MSAKEWYVYDHGAPPVGPFSSGEVLEQHQAGALSKGARLCAVEGGEWRPVADVMPVLLARTGDGPAPWFIFREGNPPLGPLTDALLQRGVEADRVPSDALLGRANAAAWYSRARALAEPPPSQAPVAARDPQRTSSERLSAERISVDRLATDRTSSDRISSDRISRHDPTMVRQAVTFASVPEEALKKQRTVLLAFCAVPVVLGVVLAMIAPAGPPPAMRAAAPGASASASASASAASVASAAPSAKTASE